MLEQLVAGVVAEAVVDLLEPVEVDQQHARAFSERAERASAWSSRSRNSARFASPVSLSWNAWWVSSSSSRTPLGDVARVEDDAADVAVVAQVGDVGVEVAPLAEPVRARGTPTSGSPAVGVRGPSPRRGRPGARTRSRPCAEQLRARGARASSSPTRWRSSQPPRAEARARDRSRRSRGCGSARSGGGSRRSAPSARSSDVSSPAMPSAICSEIRSATLRSALGRDRARGVRVTRSP